MFEGLWVPSVLCSNEDRHAFDRELAYFLQLFLADVNGALQRAAWRSSETREELCTLRILLGIGIWFFNALTHGLVQVPENEQDIELDIKRGHDLISLGERKEEQGKDILAEMEEDDFNDTEAAIALKGK